MSSEADKIAQFQSITGAPESIARSFLESTSWDLQTAAENFFETGEEDEMPDLQPTVEDEDEDVSWGPPSQDPQPHFAGAPQPAPQSSSSSRNPQRRAAPANRFASLSDFNNNEDDDDDEGRQNLFAGGEKSGLSIQNPNNPPSSAQDEVRNILRTAMSNAAGLPQPPTNSPSQNPIFSGTGYTLGSDSTPSQPVSTGGTPLDMGRMARPEPVRRTLTIWRNGFTIDEGPLFPFTNPESVEILREIRMGRVPRNVAGVQMGEDVEMRLVKKENEDWAPTVAARGGGGGGHGGAFVGHGNRLGSAIPGDPGVIAPTPVAAAATTSATDKPAQPTPDIDPSLPQTTIQLRLADGTRLVTQFNLSSTMEDVYTFIARARPTAGREFVLQTIFPTRVLEKSAKTVEEEGLKGGTVVMRWK